jgi:hypothetical protein
MFYKSKQKIEETIDILVDEKFSTYYNAGIKAGESIEAIKEAFEKLDEQFLIESSFYNGIQQRINSIKASGHHVRNMSVQAINGVPHAEFTVQHKDGTLKHHIVHGGRVTVRDAGVAKPEEENPIDTDPNSKPVANPQQKQQN